MRFRSITPRFMHEVLIKRLFYLLLAAYCLINNKEPVYAQMEQAGLSVIRVQSDSVYDTIEINRLIDSGKVIAEKVPNSSRALKLFLEAMKRSIKLGYVNGAADACYHAGCSYKDRGAYDSGIAVFSTGLRYGRHASDQNTAGKLFNGLATCYALKGDDKLSAFYSYKVLEEIRADRLTHPHYKAISLNNIGFLWVRLKDSTQARYYLQQAEMIARINGAYRDLVGIYHNYGYFHYTFNNDPEKMRAYYTAALKLSRKHKDISGQQISIHNIGSSYLEFGMSKKAIPYFRSALRLKSNSDPYTSFVGEYYALAGAYYTLKDYPTALKYLKVALREAEAKGLKDLTMRCYMLMYAIKGATSDFREGLVYALKFIDLKDSLTNVQNNRAIRDMEIRYRTSEKDKLIMQKQLLISKQESNLKGKNIIIGLISGGSLLIITLLTAMYRINQHKQTVQAKQIWILKQEQEIDRLRAMMQGEERERNRIARELHDGIGGMLVAVRMNLSVVKKEYEPYKSTGKLDDIIDLLNDTSLEVRKTAHNLMPDILTKHKLSEALIIFCENINTGEGPDIELQFHGDIDQLDKSITLTLYRIVQELVQNIIKHANASFAVVQMVQNDEKLSIFVEDNGTGFDVNQRTMGYGLESLRFRVMMLQGEISIESEKGKSTTVYIAFDLEKLRNNTIA